MDELTQKTCYGSACRHCIRSNTNCTHTEERGTERGWVNTGILGVVETIMVTSFSLGTQGQTDEVPQTLVLGQLAALHPVEHELQTQTDTQTGGRSTHCLFVYCRLVAPTTAKGHPQGFTLLRNATLA